MIIIIIITTITINRSISGPSSTLAPVRKTHLRFTRTYYIHVMYNMRIILFSRIALRLLYVMFHMRTRFPRFSRRVHPHHHPRRTPRGFCNIIIMSRPLLLFSHRRHRRRQVRPPARQQIVALYLLCYFTVRALCTSAGRLCEPLESRRAAANHEFRASSPSVRPYPCCIATATTRRPCFLRTRVRAGPKCLFLPFHFFFSS